VPIGLLVLPLLPNMPAIASMMDDGWVGGKSPDGR
jgi:hypothetical protein